MIKEIKYKAKEISNIVNGTLVGEDVLVNSLTINSKIVSKNACFFAIKGEKFNGNDFVKEAVAGGAILIITEEKIVADVSVIYVKSVIRALGELAKHHKGKTRIIGVTGSAGKTTTKEMIISVLREKYSVCGTIENQNNEIGVALTLMSIKNHDFCVVEMGMRAIGEINWLSYIAEPYISVITNCGSAHIGRLGSVENIFKAKTEILNFTQKYALMPDEKRFKALNNDLNTVFIGADGDVFCKNVKFEENKINFDIGGKFGHCEQVAIKSHYFHNINNALNAYAVGKLTGIDDNSIKMGLSKYVGVSLREEIIKIKDAEVIVDCYNASYESVISAITSLKEYATRKGKKSVAVLGDMLELGEQTKKLHKSIGILCKEIGISALYAIGDYAEGYVEGYCGGEALINKEEAAKKIFDFINEDYIFLLKASRKCQFEKITDYMRELENVK